MPAVSIVVPVYNAQKSLRRLAQSVLAQPPHELELILVDDGSTDASGPLCDALARQDARVRVLHTPNAGPAAARNAGLARAAGDYVGFADADDEALPGLYETLYARAKEADADLSFCDYIRQSGDAAEPCETFPGGDRVFDRAALRARILPYFFGYAKGELAHCEALCPFADRRSYVWLCLYRRALLQEAGIRFPDEKLYYTEDNLFNLQAAAAAARAVYVAQPLYHYYDAAQSFTGRFDPAYLDCRLRKYAYLQDFAEKNGLQSLPAERLPRKICVEIPTLVNYYASLAPTFGEKLRGVRRVLGAPAIRAALAAVPKEEWPRGRVGTTLALARAGGALPLTLACLAQRTLRGMRR